MWLLWLNTSSYDNCFTSAKYNSASKKSKPQTQTHKSLFRCFLLDMKKKHKKNPTQNPMCKCGYLPFRRENREAITWHGSNTQHYSFWWESDFGESYPPCNLFKYRVIVLKGQFRPLLLCPLIYKTIKEWMKISTWCWTISTQSTVCSQRQVCLSKSSTSPICCWLRNSGLGIWNPLDDVSNRISPLNKAPDHSEQTNACEKVYLDQCCKAL